MNLRALVLVAFVAFVTAVGCNEPKVANRCAGEVEPHCITRVICSFDQKRGCEVCTCDSPFPTPALSADPTLPPLR